VEKHELKCTSNPKHHKAPPTKQKALKCKYECGFNGDEKTILQHQRTCTSNPKRKPALKKPNDFECEYDCGFDGATEAVVEAHELLCTGNPSNTKTLASGTTGMHIDEEEVDLLEEEADVTKLKEATEPCNCHKKKSGACGQCKANHCTCKTKPFSCEFSCGFDKPTVDIHELTCSFNPRIKELASDTSRAASATKGKAAKAAKPKLVGESKAKAKGNTKCDATNTTLPISTSEQPDIEGSAGGAIAGGGGGGGITCPPSPSTRSSPRLSPPSPTEFQPQASSLQLPAPVLATTTAVQAKAPPKQRLLTKPGDADATQKQLKHIVQTGANKGFEIMYTPNLLQKISVSNNQYRYPVAADLGDEQESVAWPLAFGFPSMKASYAPPAPWMICVDPTSKNQYFYNPETGRSLWTLLPAHTKNQAPIINKATLPKPWQEYVDPRSLQPFYYNPDTDQTVTRLKEIAVEDAKKRPRIAFAQEEMPPAITDVDPPIYTVTYDDDGLPFKRRLVDYKKKEAPSTQSKRRQNQQLIKRKVPKPTMRASSRLTTSSSPQANQTSLSSDEEEEDNAAMASAAWHQHRVRLIMHRQEEAEHTDSNESNDDDACTDDEPAVFYTTVMTAATKQRWTDATTTYFTNENLYTVGTGKTLDERQQRFIRKKMQTCCLAPGTQSGFESNDDDDEEEEARNGAGFLSDSGDDSDAFADSDVHAATLPPSPALSHGSSASSASDVLGCDVCHKWFHPKCAGIDPLDIPTLDDPWECAICFASRRKID
jgi:hypothetical protein